ncbi:MAG: peptidylprolyl isomerase [Bdellovibrionales bacterium]|jgi:peptidyl-prolyl cis-trans isomerase C/peptidyl-prolyl cis-trans isomerase D|nr:peptidylprolyl isomerase [Bdellovibrionales bacterium]
MIRPIALKLTAVSSLPLATLLASLFIASVGMAQAGDIVAVVGTKQISVKELNEKYDEVVRQTINPPTKEVFLEDLIRYEMGVQEAYKRNLQEDPIVKERIRQEIYKGLVERELGKKVSEIKVTNKEMQAYYRTNPEIRTSHILIEFRPDATADQKKAARDRANEILAEVRKGRRPFAEYVGLYTDDVLSKTTGGDVGWQTALTLVPSYYSTALAMKNNEVRGLIETQYGFHIIQKTGQRSYAEANKRTIRAAVFEQKRRQLFDAYFAQLKRRYPVKVNKDKIK